MDNKIDEELRHYKLFKIQEAESKIKRFNNKYEEIKEHIAIKISKNVTSNIFRAVISILSILFLILGIISFFPEKLIEFMEADGANFTFTAKANLIDLARLLMYFFIAFFIILTFTSYLLRLNNRKRDNLYSLSKLLEEVIAYMENSRDDDKRKYEQFVDLMAERNRKKNN
uniref:hypothetical protein n=1 Tax=Bizionia sp. TaxID=1954480 RepID=UPI003A924A73